MLLLVVLRNIICQVLVSQVPFHDELLVIDLVAHIKIILLHLTLKLIEVHREQLDAVVQN